VQLLQFRPGCWKFSPLTLRLQFIDVWTEILQQLLKESHVLPGRKIAPCVSSPSVLIDFFFSRFVAQVCNFSPMLPSAYRANRLMRQHAVLAVHNDLAVAARGFPAPGGKCHTCRPLGWNHPSATLFWRPLPLAPGGNCPSLTLPSRRHCDLVCLGRQRHFSVHSCYFRSAREFFSTKSS
jgi:hypothetical protein